jgi:hypothetical protein
MSTINKSTMILATLAIMFTFIAASVQPASAAASCTQWHTVQRGEYLVQIARLYSTSWRTLAEINDLDDPSRIYPGQKLCVSYTGSSTSTEPITQPSTNGIRVYATSVVEDESVTLRGISLTAGSRYAVYMSRYTNRKHAPVYVGSVLTDKNGAFTTTFLIPNELVDVAKIAVRINNGSSSAANWFINATSRDYTGGEGAATPTFSIVAVEEDDWIKIKTNNLPPNVTFMVRMGKAGTKGIDGILVGTMFDDDGGGVRATFEIPDELVGKAKLDIRLENKALGMSYYMTLDNKTTR